MTSRRQVDQEAIYRWAKTYWAEAARDPRLEPVGVNRMVDHLEVTFRWRGALKVQGVRIALPRDANDATWLAWDPTDEAEWAEYAVRQAILEELRTGLTEREEPVQ